MELIYLLLWILIGAIIISIIANILRLYMMHLEKKYQNSLKIDNEPIFWNVKPEDFDWEDYDSEK